MSLSLHALSVEVFAARLAGLAAILEKLAAHCAARKIDPAAFLQARLYPDMFTLGGQIQMATDFANRAASRLAGLEPAALPDQETTLPEFQARIARVLAILAALDPAAVDAGAERPVSFRTGPETSATLPGARYLTEFAMPNFYFHVTTAFAILRHNGLEIGKRDFFGPLKP